MNPLTPLVPCAEEDPCTPLDAVVEGGEVVVTDPLTNCAVRMTNSASSVVASNGSKAYLGTGAAGSPINLNLLQEQGTPPRLVSANGSGDVGKFSAPSDATVKVVTAYSGGFHLDDFLPPACFEEDQVCECDPDWVAGYQKTLQPDGSYKWCLVRFDIDNLPQADPQFFASTNTVSVTGAGTAGDPFKFHVKISGDAGNIVEARADGIFTECCLYGDPLDAL